MDTPQSPPISGAGRIVIESDQLPALSIVIPQNVPTPLPLRWWQRPEIITNIVLSLMLLSVTSLQAYILWKTVQWQEKAVQWQESAEVFEVLRTYIDAYRSFTDKNDSNILSNAECFERATPAQKQEVQIIAGLLVMVVDEMYATDDPRAKQWAKYIKAIPGPLAPQYEVDAYATNKNTIDVLETTRRDLSQQLPEKCLIKGVFDYRPENHHSIKQSGHKKSR
jgi:hypothetical protein